LSTPDVALTLIGGPTVLIEIAGLRLITDPSFSEPGVYRSGQIALEKRVGPALSPEAIGRIDAVLLSHDQHSDNLDPAGRAMLSQAGIVFTTEAGARRLGGNARGLAPWEGTVLDGPSARLHITATPARHGPAGIEPLSGDVVGFLIGLEAPGDAIYLTGDTVWYEGTAEVARRYRPRLVLAFAGAAQTRGPFHLTMDSNDVLETAHAFPDARIVPVHTDGWAHFTQSGEDLARAFAALGRSERLFWLRPGEPARLPL
jgi:L-ascorbate metabolism protein UlaG (beta-lactamase superfamily)